MDGGDTLPSLGGFNDSYFLGCLGTDNGRKDTIKPKKDKIRAREGKEHEKPRQGRLMEETVRAVQNVGSGNEFVYETKSLFLYETPTSSTKHHNNNNTRTYSCDLWRELSSGFANTLLLAEERFLKIKQAVEEEQNQPKVMQELLLKLMKDLQIFNGIQSKQVEQEEPAAQNFLINLNFPMADDDEYTVIYRKPKAITPDLPIEEPDNSLNICDVPSCDHFDAECGLINSLLSRDSSITSPKIDFLPEEFVGELDFIDPILPGIDEDDFDEENFDVEEEGINNDILQIEDEILREKLLNVNLLVDKIEALKLTSFIPFVLENPFSSPIPVVDSDFLIEEVDTFL
ncbi:hypothetical protein Tco_0156057, partial [Tanacetum coccineum]